MVVAAREGTTRWGSRCDGSAARAIATKYPADRDAHYFAATGRQAEIVEVKGSVELAPLTGLVDAIVDLTATGRTLVENRLVELEEIFESSARG